LGNPDKGRRAAEKCQITKVHEKPLERIDEEPFEIEKVVADDI